MKRRKMRIPKVSSPSPSLPHHHPMVKKIPEASDNPMMTPSEYRSSNNISRVPSSYNPSSVSNPPDSRSINIYGVDFDTSGSLSQNHAHHHHHHGGPLSNQGNGSLDREMSDFSPSNGSSGLDDRRMRRTRTFIDPTSEIPRLEQWFMMTSHPSRSQIERFTEELNKLEYRRKFPRLEAKNLQFWFKNRRAKQKRLTNGSSNPVHLMNGPLSTGQLSSSSSSGHNHSPPPPPSSISPILSSGSHHSLVQSHHHHMNPLSSSAHALSSASATNLLHHHLSQTLNSNVVDLSVSSSSSNQISPSSNHHHNQTPSPRDANNRDANNRDANNRDAINRDANNRDTNNRDANNRDANILNNNNNHSKNMSIRAPSPDHSESASQSPIPMNGPILAPSGVYPSFDTKQQSITKNGANFIK